MNRTRSGSLLRVISLALLTLIPPTHADTPAENPRKQIPDPLKAWENWALWDDADRDCPRPYSTPGKHLCFWPSRFGLRVEKTGAQFDMVVRTFSETWVPLPGGSDAWPLEVRANDAAVPVLEHSGVPSIKLAAGEFHLTGSYHWASIPQRIPMPREVGILALVIDGQPVEAPVWDAQGFLWLQRNGSNEEADKNSLTTKIYAQFADGIPLWLHLQIELTVSGKSREEQIGTILPEGWKLSSVESPIPAIIDDAGKMKAQVRAGRRIVKVDAFRLDNPKEFHFAPGAKPAVGDELVAFAAAPGFRTVEITDLPPVDPSQTTFPQQWRDNPVYRWSTGTPFRFEERMRGMGQQKAEGLRITRELWLDDRGKELTFRDHITGRSQEIWRLDAAAGQDLGSVRSSGEGQLITRNAQNGASGVEIRTRDLDLEATGRMARAAEISATGWRSDADTLSTTLNLPPGWRLFALFGADWVEGDWLTAWTLLDLFLLLIFSLAVFRLWGWGPAVLAFLGFGLSFHEPGAPRYLWLFLLVPLALQRVVREGWGRRIVATGKWIIIVAFLLILIPFLARQVQQMLYPQLEVLHETSWSPSIRGLTPATTAEVLQEAPAPSPESPPPASAEAIRRRLNRIIIPKLEFREATLREAIDFLKKKSVDLDDQSPAGERGVNIVLKLDNGAYAPNGLPPTPGIPGVPGLEPPIPGNPPLPGAVVNPADTRLTVSLTNIPLGEALKYITGLANLKFKVEPYAVAIVPLSEPTDVLITKEWKIPPSLIPQGKGGGAKEWLIANGVMFNGAASATYIQKSSRLIVRNTQDQLDLVDQVIPAGGVEPAAPAAGTESLFSSKAGTEKWGYEPKARIQTGPGVPEWT